MTFPESSLNTGRIVPLISRWSLATIVFYRVLTYVVIFFWGGTDWWHEVKSDRWNHYQIGLVLLPAAWILYRKGKRNLSFVLVAVASGMIIDEIADVLAIFRLYAFGVDFRDSVADLVLILLAYSLFILILNVALNRYRKA